MKILLTLVLITSFAISAEKKKENIEVCKTYIDQAQKFKKSMGDDELSKQTLEFYKEKMYVHCGSVTAKTKFERKSFVKMMMKEDKTTTVACKKSIKMASNYSQSKEQSSLIIAAHKENIVDNCGALVASHVSSYCLYDESK